MPTESKYVLTVGGAGYIGSHMLFKLREHGFIPIVLDNLSTGNAHAVHESELIFGDVTDKKLLNELFSAYQFCAVIHFAACIDVAESINQPYKYYYNNVLGSLALLDVMRRFDVECLIFSSSASVYGQPQHTPIHESHALNPMSPYGRSKMMVEQMIQDFHKSYGLRYAILRYFNAAGCDPAGRIGECHSPETHLIPLVLRVAAGLIESIPIFGDSFATKDGTCVRDYVHVMDICDAHILALQHLLDGKASLICNLGAGQGHSILEVINAVQAVTKRSINTRYCPPRLGDPSCLVADISMAKQALSWQPKYSALEMLVSHTWNFMHNHIL